MLFRNGARPICNRGAISRPSAKERSLAALRPGVMEGGAPRGGRFARWSRGMQWSSAARWRRVAAHLTAGLLALSLEVTRAVAIETSGASVSATLVERAAPAARLSVVPAATAVDRAGPAAGAPVELPPVPAAKLPRVPPLEPPLARAPLDPPLVLHGGFGDYRSNHFHAGLDLGTGGRVGRPVFAPLAGWVERVRASGVGYGRSLYLHADDGRLLVFGHLDAFAEPLAAFIAHAQDSTGQYEQDLWPVPGRFPVAAGQPIAWTGESGAGGPHLHFEIRRGDMAYDPRRAGLALPDSFAPVLVSLTLEPLDDHSYVERSAAPHTIGPRAWPETLSVVGRLRAIVGVRDGVWSGVDRMVPWSTVIECGGERVECRFDSVSWATDMVESDYVYDAGRVVGEKGIVMWAPSGFRPRVLLTTAPPRREAGTLMVRHGDPPRVLRIAVRDLAGGIDVREVVLRPPGRDESGPDPGSVGGGAQADSSRWFDLALLPGRYLRIQFRGAPAGSRRVTIGGRPASFGDGTWSAVVALPHVNAPSEIPLSLRIGGQDGDGRPWRESFVASLRADPSVPWRWPREPAVDWRLDRAAAFEPGPILYRYGSGPPRASLDLAPRSSLLELMPVSLPLRKPLRLELSPGDGRRPRVGLYADDGTGWSWLAAPVDSGLGRRIGGTRHLGRFALFEDTLAPRIAPRRPGRRPVSGPYSRWALEARLVDEGSGVDARSTRFEVDGRRVPSEWDAEEGILRWRPRRPPARGAHRFTVIATDRAGNERRASRRFFLK